MVQSIRGPHGLLLLPAFSPTKPDTATPCQPPRQSPPPPSPSPPPWCCCATRSSILGQILQRINRDADYRCTILPQLLATHSTFSTLPPKFPFPGSVEADFLHSMAFQSFQSCTLLYFRDGKPKYHYSLSICKPISKEECACLHIHMRARNWTKTSLLPTKNLIGQHCVLVWPLGVQSSATEHHFLDIARAVPGSFKRNAEACVSFCGKLPRAVAVAIRRAMRTVCPAMWQKSLSEWP